MTKNAHDWNDTMRNGVAQCAKPGTEKGPSSNTKPRQSGAFGPALFKILGFGLAGPR
jgi:hypothetical protein